jgi:hypothetical protein
VQRKTLPFFFALHRHSNKLVFLLQELFYLHSKKPEFLGKNSCHGFFYYRVFMACFYTRKTAKKKGTFFLYENKIRTEELFRPNLAGIFGDKGRDFEWKELFRSNCAEIGGPGDKQARMRDRE